MYNRPLNISEIQNIFSSDSFGKCKQINCGANITTNTTLTNDLLNCPSTGLIIGADNITLICNGHFISAISGSNQIGILINSRKNIEIRGCFISNFGNGIYAKSMNNSNLTKNAFVDNLNGLVLNDSYSNLIYNNYFDNLKNIYANKINTWNITKTLGTNVIGGKYVSGNYWGDYNGFDLNNDSIGDTKLYYNSSGNISQGGDYGPLTEENICNKNLSSDPFLNNYFKLGANLICSGNGPTFGNNSLTLDCNGYKITGAGTGNGVFAYNKINLTLKNCKISNFYEGVLFDKITSSRILNIESFSNLDNGIFLNDSHYNNATCGWINITISNVQNAYINRNYANFTCQPNSTFVSALSESSIDPLPCIQPPTKTITVCSGNKLHDNGIFGFQSGFGLYLFKSTNNYIGESEIYKNNMHGAVIDSSSSNKFNNNSVTFNIKSYVSNNNAGVLLTGVPTSRSNFNTFTNNTISNNYGNGVSFTEAKFNSFTHNWVEFNGVGGSPLSYAGLFFSDTSGQNYLNTNRVCFNNYLEDEQGNGIGNDIETYTPQGTENNYGPKNICDTGNWDDSHGGACNYTCRIPIIFVPGFNGDKDTFDPTKFWEGGSMGQIDLLFALDYRDGAAKLHQTISQYWAQNKELTFPYNYDVPHNQNLPNIENGDIDVYAYVLSNAIDYVRTYSLSKKVDVVTHSTGGLIARDYINDRRISVFPYYKPFKYDIRKLIEIAPPNHGLDLPAFMNDLKVYGYLFGAIPGVIIHGAMATIGFFMGGGLGGVAGFTGVMGDQLTPHSDFLNSLNMNNNDCPYPLTDCASSSLWTANSASKRDYVNTLSGVEYHSISTRGSWSTIIHRHFDFWPVSGQSEDLYFRPWLTGDGDSVVPWDSANLTGASLEIPTHPIDFCSHGCSTRNVDVIDKVKTDLLPYASKQASNSVSKPTKDNGGSSSLDNLSLVWSFLEYLPINISQIFYTFTVDNTSKKVYLFLDVQNPQNNITLSIKSPSGKIFNSTSSSANYSHEINEIFNKEFYIVDSNESGLWNVSIIPIQVNGTDNISVLGGFLSDLSIYLATDKVTYLIGQRVNISGFITKNGQNIPASSFIANISIPNNTSTIINLYDDGLHGDGASADGLYGNSYLLPNISGSYLITTTANTTINGTTFSRTTRALIMSKLCGDLIGTGDIHLGNVQLMALNVFTDNFIPNSEIADANGDKKVNILDYVIMQNHIFRNGTSPSCTGGVKIGTGTATPKIGTANLIDSVGKYINVPIKLENTGNIAGLTFTVNFNSSKYDLTTIAPADVALIFNTRYQENSNSINITFYSDDGVPRMPQGNWVLANMTFRPKTQQKLPISGDISIPGTSTLAADLNGNKMPNTLCRSCGSSYKT